MRLFKVTALITFIIVGFIIAFTFHFMALAAIDAPHNEESNNVECGSCHGEGILESVFWGGSGTYDSICLWKCHTEPFCPYTSLYGPYVKTHNDSDETAHAECRTCHDPHYQEQKTYKNTDWNNLYLAYGEIIAYQYYDPDDYEVTYFDPNLRDTSVLTYSSINYKTDTGWDATKLTGKTEDCRHTILFPNLKKLGYSYVIIAVDENTNTIAVKGEVSNNTIYEYTTPPSDFAVIYGQFIRDNINGNPVKFFDRKGANSFSDGDGVYNGVCEVCHTQTMYHKKNGSGDSHYPAVRCSICHNHVDGLLESDHTTRSGADCEGCHGHDNGWNGGNYFGTTTSHSTHTENDSDDLKGPLIDCGTCHDIYNYPYFKSGTDGNSDGKIDLSETDVCDTCHSPDGSFDGVDDAAIGAKNNWSSSVYDSQTLKAGKEKWCAGCHDGSVADVNNRPGNSRADGTGVWAPEVIGDNTTYGFYVSGHNIDCLSCHDATLTHIDHDHRTYEFDENTGKAVNPYTYSYRLKALNGQPSMRIPTPNNSLADFPLCLDCHDSSEIVGANINDIASTNFWNDETDDQGRTYGDGDVRNSHYYHAINLGHVYDSDFDGRSGNESSPTCVTCHNVHGSPTGPMIRHGELISTPGTTDKVPALDFAYLDAGYNPNSNTTLEDSTGGRMRYLGIVVCFMCHGNISYYRSPNLAPRIVNQQADPEVIVIEGAARNVLLTTKVIDHDDNITSVTIDLTPIGGGAAQLMYDDGTNGDVTPGDNVYSYQALIPVTTGSAEKSLTITSTDLDAHTGQGELILPVLELNAGVIVWEGAVPHEITFESDLNIIGSLIIGNGDTLNIRGDITIGSTLTVQNGGTLVLLGNSYDINPVAGGTEDNPYGRGSTITSTDITIESGGSVNADGKGFDTQKGPGKGYAISYNGSGAGYGGAGGNSTNGATGGLPYGITDEPTALGSGGGDSSNGGAGGGAIKLVVSGTITIDGILSVDGDDGVTAGARYGGGGSGGSVWIASGILTGSGTISANGGDGSWYGGAGGGGRIDISETTYSFTGTVSVAGGNPGNQQGLPGTILFPAGFWNNVTITENMTLENNVTVSGSLTISTGATLTISGDLFVGTTLTVDDGGALVLVGNPHDINGGTAGNPYGSGPTVTATDIMIADGGSMNADCTGFPDGNGPGHGSATYYIGSGGGYGGEGGHSTAATGGSTYGSSSSPTALGSGGGEYLNAGAGGGAIKLISTGTISVDGTLSANGCSGITGGGRYGGGGSGGSLWIASGILTGSGTISATGGNGDSYTRGGGGGGGRIDVSGTTYSFTGTITASGGETAFDRGMPGTVIFPTGFWNNLTLNHNITLGNDVTVTGFLTIGNGATLTTSGDLTVDTTLTADNGGILVLKGETHNINGGTAENPYGSGPTVTATDIMIADSGSMNADGQGFRGSNGPGLTLNPAGAGYGGAGGNNSGGATGGSTYGNASAPSALGSGGGTVSSLFFHGGVGGGAMKLTVTGTVTVNGVLSANGTDGIYGGGADGGGGSGGSLWIDSGTLTGSGTISVSGGNGNRATIAGGGGGGRIDVSGTTNNFAGTVTSNGGTGFQNGGVGTILP